MAPGIHEEGRELRFEHGDRVRLVVASCLTAAALPILLREGKEQHVNQPTVATNRSSLGKLETRAEEKGAFCTREAWARKLWATGLSLPCGNAGTASLKPRRAAFAQVDAIPGGG